MTTPVVVTEALTRDYGGGAGLHGVDLAVPRHSVYGLVGPNGAGKTTLLSIIAGLRRAGSGDVRLGVPRERVAICPDTPHFEPFLTAAEVVGQSRGLVFGRRPARASACASAPAVLAQVGLAGVADRRVGGFSRGMTQRLGLAVALALEPELLILDEPTSALDPAGRAEVLSLIAGLARDRTVIFSSHILADVQRVATDLGVLDHGRLLFQGPTRALLDTYVKPAWQVRVRGRVDEVAERLRAADWVTGVVRDQDDTLRVEAVSGEAGERGLPGLIAGTGARLVSLNPVDADLETAFLTLTGDHG